MKVILYFIALCVGVVVYVLITRSQSKRQKERLTLELPFLSEVLMLEAPWGKIHFDKVKPIIEALEREGKSLAPHIKSEEYKQACLDDLEKIIRCAEVEVSVESKAQATDHQRKNDLERFVPLSESQKGRVKAWRGYIEYTEQITFETLDGSAEITRNADDEVIAFAVALSSPNNWYTLIVEKDGQEPATKPISPDGIDSFDFVKMGIGAIRSGRITIEHEKSGQRERVPFW